MGEGLGNLAGGRHQTHENGYEIGHDELGAEQDMGQNWLGHMAGKRWVDLNTFVPAYIEACRRAKIETVYIDYTHIYPED